MFYTKLNFLKLSRKYKVLHLLYYFIGFNFKVKGLVKELGKVAAHGVQCYKRSYVRGKQLTMEKRLKERKNYNVWPHLNQGSML
jgi:hypothetical protein